jgi:hypothetical protein
MATIGTASTLLDIAKRLDPNGKIDKIVEQLAQTNELLDDMMFVEANEATGHTTTVRSGLPSATWRKLNYGVQPSKSTTKQVKDTIGMLEAYSIVDKSLADLNGNTSEFRMSEDRAFLESMNQTMAATAIYGDTSVNPERFMGVAPRFNAISTDTSQSGSKIINGGGAGSDNTSIWLIVWGPNTVHGLYPKGSKAGFSHHDQGQQTVLDAAGGSYEAYRSHYKWDCGLTVRDWRYIVRVANIDVSELTKNASAGADLIDLMAQACELVQDLNMGKPAFYCNRLIKGFLRRQIVNKTASSSLTMEEVGGKPVMGFAGVPVRRVDQILNTEATIA